MRYLFSSGRYQGKIAAAMALEGAGNTTVVSHALGSRRFRVTICGPGGHSWTDAGAPNPIMLLSRGLAELDSIPLPDEPRTVLSAGRISGGTSINSIPESASVLLDLRSTDASHLLALEREVHRSFELAVSRSAHPPASSPALRIELIGDRPTGQLAEDAPILRTVRAVDRHLGLRTEFRIGSTDANIPLSMGIPAIAISAGGTGGGIHTLSEWYDPTGREIALRRILLTLLDLASST